MRRGRPFSMGLRLVVLAGIAGSIVAVNVIAQHGPAAIPEAKVWTTAEDHQNMMQQLGIRKLRPAPSGSFMSIRCRTVRLRNLRACCSRCSPAK